MKSQKIPDLTFAAGSDWLKPVMEGPMKLYSGMWHEALRLTARALHEQANYMQKLSECSDPAEALKCHGEFVQQSLTRSIDESSKMLVALQSNLSPHPTDDPGKP